METVSIHAPARGATGRENSGENFKMFQSTRPRGARHFQRAYLAKGVCKVSIHAPARGATANTVFTLNDATWVSIHAPARGATAIIYGYWICRAGFNPRAREGRDHPTSHKLTCLGSFNPRAREGRDRHTIRPCVGGIFQFQSTRPRGARRAADRPDLA